MGAEGVGAGVGARGPRMRAAGAGAAEAPLLDGRVGHAVRSGTPLAVDSCPLREVGFHVPCGLAAAVTITISGYNFARRANNSHDTARTRTIFAHTASNVKMVAGSIAHISRESEPPTLQAVGAASTNQAVKAVAIARTFVETDGLDFNVEPMRVTDEEIHNLVQLRLEKRQRREPAADVEFVDLKSATQTETSSLAGAIANNVRDGLRVRVTAVGASPVFKAVDAIIRARTFLEEDSVDLSFSPEFTTLRTEDGGSLNAVQFVILARQL